MGFGLPRRPTPPPVKFAFPLVPLPRKSPVLSQPTLGFLLRAATPQTQTANLPGPLPRKPLVPVKVDSHALEIPLCRALSAFLAVRFAPLRINIRRLNGIVQTYLTQECGEHPPCRSWSKPSPDTLMCHARRKIDFCSHASTQQRQNVRKF